MSAVHGLTPLVVDGRVMGGTTGYAAELVFQTAEKLCEAPRLEGRRLHLRPKPSSGETAATLAKALRGPAFAHVAVEGDELVLELAPDQEIPPPGMIFFERGPFEDLGYASGHLRLRRRTGTGPATIEFVAVDSEQEEWRRFLAREVDVVPEVRPSYTRYLVDVPSVRLLPSAQSYSYGFLFRVDSGALTDLRLRRAIALGVRRAALARVVGGAPAAVKVSEDGAEARRLVEAVRAERGALPVIHVIVFSQNDEEKRAVRVLEQQLGELGLSLEFVVVSVENARERLLHGNVEAILMPAGTAPYYFRRALTGHPHNMTGYSNPAFDAAVAAGDIARATAILETDVPMTPLYQTSTDVAIDRRFCGAHPVTVDDLSWLANVHTCRPGETE